MQEVGSEHLQGLRTWGQEGFIGSPKARLMAGKGVQGALPS